ncbi:hypothetical protein JZ751_009780 [Albula glossodonta]|uniref:Uncharacterized protein n=1 Tax=Albula glossodonta TaxID=121402 RepID=A0A8T2NYL4_9TELE|nr:hypothetical protein JZ751_009780 [Albula glossodonta]
MAVCRRGFSLWLRWGLGHGGSPSVQIAAWRHTQGTGLLMKSNLNWLLSCPHRPISSISWALTPPSCLRYQAISQSAISEPLTHHVPEVGQPDRSSFWEEDRKETISLCVLLGPGDGGGQRTLMEVPLGELTGLRELLSTASVKRGEFLLSLTTVDGRREDDISVRGGERKGEGESKAQEKESFRSLFEKESCPAPFVLGSRFYCFHCPVMDSLFKCMDEPRGITSLDPQTSALSVLPSVSYCAHRAENMGEGMDEREREREEKLALMHEKLREELPRFFLKSHDYSMYSPDVEFINGLLNTKTRGRTLYQLSLSVWKLLCACYFAEVRLEVLKLTKHSEDGTVMPAQPPVLPRVTLVLARALVALGLQEHRPALNLLPLLLSSFKTGLGRQ